MKIKNEIPYSKKRRITRFMFDRSSDAWPPPRIPHYLSFTRAYYRNRDGLARYFVKIMGKIIGGIEVVEVETFHGNAFYDLYIEFTWRKCRYVVMVSTKEMFGGEGYILTQKDCKLVPLFYPHDSYLDNPIVFKKRDLTNGKFLQFLSYGADSLINHASVKGLTMAEQ